MTKMSEDLNMSDGNNSDGETDNRSARAPVGGGAGCPKWLSRLLN